MPRALNAYRRLVKLYPARFREEYGRPLEQQFVDEYREADGRLTRAVLWARVIADFVVSMPRELLREVRDDMRYAARVYLRHPLVTVLALVALSLAVGATTGVFSVVNALLLRSLPFREPERIVQVEPSRGIDSSTGFHAWRKQSPFLEDAASLDRAEMNLNQSADAVRIQVTETSYNFFSLLGCQPVLGRAFAAGEDVPGRDHVAVISYTLWQQIFAGEPRALGSTILLNGQPTTVVGVAPRLFDFPSRTAVWTPTVFDLKRLPKTDVTYWETIGRLKAGLTLAQANSMFGAGAGRKVGDFVERRQLTPMRDQLAGPVRRASLVLFGSVLFVLLVACANVANLVLTRVTDRRRELVVRAALGASRARLVQQLITETVVLALVAAGFGFLVAQWAARLARSAQPVQLAVQEYTVLDWRVVGFAMIVSVLVGVAFGVVPAWLVARLQPAEDLVHGRAHGGSANHLRGVLVAVQVSATVVLLAGSIVFSRSFLKLVDTDLGFRPDHGVSLRVSLVGTPYDTEPGRAAFYRNALEKLRSVPGVESAAITDVGPFASGMMGAASFISKSGRRLTALWIFVTPDYFRTIGTSIAAGRGLTEADKGGPDRIAVVDDNFANRIGEGTAIVGQTLTAYGGRRVVVAGVVPAFRYWGPEHRESPTVFMPLDESRLAAGTFLVRVRDDANRSLAKCRDALKSVDSRVAVFGMATFDDLLWTTLARPRFYATVVVFFGVFALLLALIGIYGVASYSIAQRVQEIGVRLAIGGTARDVRAMLLRQGLVPIVAGLVAGIAGALALGRVLQHLITAGQRIDPATCAAAVVLLAGAAAAALWSATRRVLRLQPIDILRSE